MKRPQLPPLRPKGFSLIVTVSLLVVLTVVAVGLLSLSVISIKSTSTNSAEERARANARMALMMAIDRLQAQMGADQRISANASILSNSAVANPHWTGVWDSWHAGADGGIDEISSHNSIYPFGPDSMHPRYDSNRERHFRQWLVSLDNDSADVIAAGRNLVLDAAYMPTQEDEAVILVGLGSLGEEAPRADFVHAPLVDISSVNDPADIVGRYGWWVGDESQKASIMEDHYNAMSSPSLAERLFRSQAPSATGTAVVEGLNDISDEQVLSRVFSRKSQELVEATDSPLRRQQRQNELKRQFHDITYSSHGVFSDVREGGLKRCLNTILERPIKPSEVYNLVRGGDGYDRADSHSNEGMDFMLYSFDDMVRRRNGNTGEASVPIQDLSAYYQLYDSSRSTWNSTQSGVRDGWRDGIIYSSSDATPPNSLLTSGIMVTGPDHGIGTSDFENYLRGYTSPYRTPVPIKLEYVIHFAAKPIIPRPPANEDQYKLHFGFSPCITLWNPNNVPLVMNYGSNPEHMTVMLREHPPAIELVLHKASTPNAIPGSSGVETTVIDFNRVTHTQHGEMYTCFISGRTPIRFEPGEAKVFSLQVSSQTNPSRGMGEVDLAVRGRLSGRYHEPFIPELELVPGWNPNRFVIPMNQTGGNRGDSTVLTFNRNEYIRTEIRADPARASFGTHFTQKSRHGRNLPGVKWFYNWWRITGRTIEGRGSNRYNQDIVHMGFPPPGGISSKAPRILNVLERRTNDIIRAMRNPYDARDDLPQAFMYYSMKSGSETHESAQGAYPYGAGRRFTSRPFLHSAPLNPLYLDQTTDNSMYNYGWNWFFMPVNNVQDVPVSITADNHGYHGGGYTAENGTTHVVQQKLPVTPPISIASLSNARLSGYSLGTEAPHWYDRFPPSQYRTEAYIRNTALGYGGLQPYMVQALGNSYAHPNIPQDRAFTIWRRDLYEVGNNIETYNEPFVDHSYLVNKAIWDDYFFSSITPKPSSIPLYETSELSAVEVARQFFFEDGLLPNKRITPYLSNLNEATFDRMVTEYGDFREGFADKIASHLLIKGPFNINSTSVDAWRTVFSSLKGKPVSFMNLESALTGGVDLNQDTPTGTPVGAASFGNGRPYTGSTSDPSDPEQWRDVRVLTDKEIDELAEAMVEQVKLRGPFLSLSEFVNRRLDSGSKEMSLKGALQAAIDDPDCSINSGFRGGDRVFSAQEKSFTGGAFPEALNGAIAYGSPAYVDQADILQNFAAQLTPRGDTFVIRAYGDALDNSGKVEARAWCEAVVQRTPEYVDPADPDHAKQEDLTSSSNEIFGRKFIVVQFRWLNASEV